jgi:hypothetical protein
MEEYRSLSGRLLVSTGMGGFEVTVTVSLHNDVASRIS